MTRVLLVDDEPDLINLLARQLTREGFEVHCADSLESAIALCQTATFDVLVTDLHLPDGDGLDVKRAVAAAVCLGVTGSRAGVDEARLKIEGFSAVLEKPVNGRALAAAISAALK